MFESGTWDGDYSSNDAKGPEVSTKIVRCLLSSLSDLVLIGSDRPTVQAPRQRGEGGAPDRQPAKGKWSARELRYREQVQCFPYD